MNDQLPAMRVRAVIHDERIFVCLADLIQYVSHPHHRVDAHCRDAIESLLVQLGVALESDG